MNNISYIIKLVFKPLDVGVDFADFIRAMYFPMFRSIKYTTTNVPITQKKKIKKCSIPSSFDLNNLITPIKKVNPKFTKTIILTTSRSTTSFTSTTKIMKSILTNKKVSDEIVNYTLMPMTIGAF
jgi:hypothetical protein